MLGLKRKDGSVMTTNDYLESKISHSRFKDKADRKIIQ